MTQPPFEPAAAREAAVRILSQEVLAALERAGLCIAWADEVQRLREEAAEARRLHSELQAIREAIRSQYQG